MSSPPGITSFVVSTLLAVFGLVASQNASVSLTPSANAAGAPGISKILSPSFAGMGIEPSNLFSFTGAETTNQMSVNLFLNLANYTGVPPHLRIGGNTGDYMIYESSFNEYAVETNPRPTSQGAIAADSFIYGPTFFQALDRFPAGTPITYGLNLAYYDSDYISRIVAQARAALTLLGAVELVSFEIGNEPDLYLQNGFRNGTWDGAVYATEWWTRASAVFEQVLHPNGVESNFFEPGCTASTIGTSFQISLLNQTQIAQPVNSSTNQSFVAGWNQHDYYYYIGVSNYTLYLDELLNLSTTPVQFFAWTQQVQQAQATTFPYYLREMATVGPIGQTGISDVFGATLWTLNFFLYAASLNISSVQMHMTDNSWAAPWAPIPMYNMPAHVRTTYYAWAAMDQLIGTGCTTRVAPVNTTVPPANYTNRLAAYATYQKGQLNAIVLLNTRLANASDTQKGQATFNLELPQYSGQKLYLSYLTADGADSMFNTTWNGVSFETSGDGTPSIVDDSVYSQDIDSNGSVSVSVRDSQAVIAKIGSSIGLFGGLVDLEACQSLAEQEPAEGGESRPSVAPDVHSIPSPTPTGKKSDPSHKSAASANVQPVPLSAVCGAVFFTIAAGCALIKFQSTHLLN